MKCLCCGKEFSEKATVQELQSRWHKSCVKKFFGVSELPELDLSSDTLIQIARESTNKGYTVPGVQKKMSLHLTSERGEAPRLTLVNYPTGYILKPQTEAYASLPEAEYLVMQMAKATGIKTVPFALLSLQSDATELAYITRRIDRILPQNQSESLKLFAMEDFCQLDYRLTEDKYRGSYERCAKIVTKYSTQSKLDLSELFLRIVYSFAAGNSDMHLKNFSLIEKEAGGQKYVLSGAYDLLPTNVIIPADHDQMALTLNGKKRNLHRNDFLKFAERSGLPVEAAAKMIDKVISLEKKYLAMCDESYLPVEMRDSLKELISKRVIALKKLK